MNPEKKSCYICTKRNVSNFWLMFFIYCGLYFLYIKLSYITSPILSHEVIFQYSFVLFVFYLTTLLLMFILLKEEIIVTKESILLKKSFLFFCYSKKTLDVKNIKKIAFYRFLTKRYLLLFPLYFRAYKTLRFQMDEGKEENKSYYFGYFLTKNEFLSMKENMEKIIENDKIMYLF